MNKIIISVLLIAIAIAGWASFFLGGAGDEAIDASEEVSLTPEELLTQADGWVEERLYQRAILNYESYLATTESEEVRAKLINAYDLRYEEDINIAGAFIKQLEATIKIYPKNIDFCKKLLDMYSERGRKANMYDTITYCLKNGMESEELVALKKKLRYEGRVYSNEYDGFTAPVNGYYSVLNENLWGVIDETGSVSIEPSYKYISPAGESGTRVYTYADECRLITGRNFVLGIFEKDVFEAGIYSEGLTPVVINDEYCYVDSFAKPVFTGYEEASAFQNGVAAVKKDGKWFFIDKTGQKVSGDFGDIVLDSSGRYLLSDVIIAADTNGKYGMYDAAYNRMNTFSCDEMDICTQSKIIAYRINDLWGFVNSAGEIIIQPKYESAKSFSYGIAAVSVEGRWGFISPEGEIVIPCQFDDADYFNKNGTCMVKRYVTSKETSEESAMKDIGSYKWSLFALNLGIRSE